MRGILVDSSVILDIFLGDRKWYEWSESILEQYGETHHLVINPVIYSEVSIGFERIEDLEKSIHGCGFIMMEIPKEALFLAGKVFVNYKKRTGVKLFPLPDFFIGAHAAVSGMELITRDTSRITHNYPTVTCISPS